MPSYRTTFMSHAHANNAVCARYAAKLRARGVDVWIDLSDGQPGHDIPEAIARQLEIRSALVLMVTTESNGSHWVRQERGAYNSLMNNAPTRVVDGLERMILPVRLSDEVPVIFRGILWIDAVGKADDAVVEEIARALEVEATISPTPVPPTPSARPLPDVGVATPARLAQPDFAGRVVEVLPPAPVAPAPPSRSQTLLPPDPKPDGSPILTRRALLVTGVSVAAAAALGGGFYWLAHDHSTGQSLGTSTATSTPRPIPVTDMSLVPASLIPLRFIGEDYGSVKVIIPPAVSVPAGPFPMGSDPAKDPQAQSDEEPQSTITIAQAYQIGQYDVTVAEYALAVQAGAVSQPPDSYITWQAQLSQPDHPVVNVSWNDAVAYVAWLARVTGDPWRLPTEAEWEKAARGTDGRIYPWGDQWDKTRAHTSDGGPGTTTPVGAYAGKGDASPYEAHDMAGNVWEWTSTLFQSYPYNPNDGRENQQSTGNRVLRGGSWYFTPRYARAAYRYYFDPVSLISVGGFRLARGAGAGSS